MNKIVLVSCIVAFTLIFHSCESLKTVMGSIGDSLSQAADSVSSDGGGDNGGSGGTSQARPKTAKFDPDKRAEPDAANWDIAKLDTAKDADYLNGVEKDAILEMNMARTNPKKYAELYIKPQLKYFSGKEYRVPGQITILTQEGAAAVNNCVAAMSSARPVDVLYPEKGLSAAAADHAADQAKTGRTGHDGSDGSDPFKRINRYGKWDKTAGENVAYGGNSGREIICQLLIDDGVPSRGHRTNTLNGQFHKVGVGFDTHTQYGYSMCIDFAGDYTGR